ncbi:hypothetical protein LOK49_LG05G00200 [Camellia lanceoleosa]|uniref:Uncharacterized protein n=1 Tax=Camellia lanceoleosa TaxID=1840588 RepID=A0ACC0HQ96_9ERIC|nr:hypothetical protein LOK49_LG05G00200 [Camellia lanceoleosa]
MVIFSDLLVISDQNNPKICKVTILSTKQCRFLLCRALFGDLIFSSSGIGADSVDRESTGNGQLFANSLLRERRKKW